MGTHGRLKRMCVSRCGAGQQGPHRHGGPPADDLAVSPKAINLSKALSLFPLHCCRASMAAVCEKPKAASSLTEAACFCRQRMHALLEVFGCIA